MSGYITDSRVLWKKEHRKRLVKVIFRETVCAICVFSIVALLGFVALGTASYTLTSVDFSQEIKDKKTLGNDPPPIETKKEVKKEP